MFLHAFRGKSAMMLFQLSYIYVLEFSKRIQLHISSLSWIYIPDFLFAKMRRHTCESWGEAGQVEWRWHLQCTWHPHSPEHLEDVWLFPNTYLLHDPGKKEPDCWVAPPSLGQISNCSNEGLWFRGLGYAASYCEERNSAQNPEDYNSGFLSLINRGSFLRQAGEDSFWGICSPKNDKPF